MKKRTVRNKLEQISDIQRRNNDRAIEHAEWLFQLNHIPERYQRIRNMVPKPGYESLYTAIMGRYLEEIDEIRGNA